ncbi:MAG: hypothetical protein KF684_10400 [Phycisphaeraceae bacterium]|nr:hypothetical protein [Phycisphaeraceae bacterium]
MREIETVLRGAAWRLFTTRLLASLVWGATVACAALALLLAAQRVFAFTVDWSVAWAATAAGVLVYALASATLRRPDKQGVARVVDEAAGLRESLSTALCVAGRDDAWSRSAVEAADERAKTVRLDRALPVRAPRSWWSPVAPLGVFALAWFLLPQWDLMGALAARQAEQQREVELVSAVTESREAERKVEAALRQLGREDLIPEDGAHSERPTPKTPDEVRRASIRRLSSVAEKLAELQNTPQAMSLEQMKNRMAELRQPGPGPMNEMIEALQRGDFQAAQRALDQMQAKMDAGQMSPEEMAAAQKQMEDLAKQLERLAKDAQELAEALEKAGLDPDLAKDLAALDEMLKKDGAGLTREQLEQLQKMLEATRLSQDQLQGMCENMTMGGMDGLAGMMGGLAGQQGNGAANREALGEALAQLDALAKQGALDELQKMLEQCEECGGSCDAEGNCTNGMCPHGKMAKRPGGGAGVGHRIGDPEQHDKTFTTKLEQAAGQGKDGPVIARTFIEGVQIRGESRASFEAVAVAAESAAAEAIDDRRVPREHHDAVKRYFGRLKSAVSGAPAPAPTPAPAPAPAPGDAAQGSAGAGN